MSSESYLLDAILHYVACGNDILRLSQSMNAIYSLILGCLSPLRLDDMYPTGDSEIKSIKALSVTLATYGNSSTD